MAAIQHNEPDQSAVKPQLAVADSPWGFTAGFIVGALLTLFALGIGAPWLDADLQSAALPLDGGQGLVAWIALNLGHSFWFFALVLALYALNLHQLARLLVTDPHSRRVSELDQLSDVWMHLFVGIGVIWTAVGMRSALQSALGDTGGSEGIIDSADNVLRKLVDGGILLALTTTIVGGVGGYLMRLIKTVLVGSRLQALFEDQQRQDVQALVAATERIELRLLNARPSGVSTSGVSMQTPPSASNPPGAADVYAPTY